MSYYIYDKDGYVGTLATNTGLQNLWKFLFAKGDEAIRSFVRKGYAKADNAFKNSLQSLPAPLKSEVGDSLKNLRSLVNKCDEIVIVTDGVGIDDEEKA